VRMQPLGQSVNHIELAVRLSDGSFDTSVKLPVDSSPENRDALVKAWFALIDQALTLVKDRQRPVGSSSS